MPCYDKKLEAVRDDFTLSVDGKEVTEVDSVLTTGEVLTTLFFFLLVVCGFENKGDTYFEWICTIDCKAMCLVFHSASVLKYRFINLGYNQTFSQCLISFRFLQHPGPSSSLSPLFLLSMVLQQLGWGLGPPCQISPCLLLTKEYCFFHVQVMLIK
jgi:hypothetical protein